MSPGWTFCPSFSRVRIFSLTGPRQGRPRPSRHLESPAPFDISSEPSAGPTDGVDRDFVWSVVGAALRGPASVARSHMRGVRLHIDDCALSFSSDPSLA